MQKANNSPYLRNVSLSLRMQKGQGEAVKGIKVSLHYGEKGKLTRPYSMKLNLSVAFY